VLRHLILVNEFSGSYGCGKEYDGLSSLPGTGLRVRRAGSGAGETDVRAGLERSSSRSS
jgi:hypothetical protein